MSQTRSDAEDLDGASAEVEPQDAAERKAAAKTAKKPRSERRAEQVKDRAKARSASAEKKAAPRKKRTPPTLFYRQIVAELRKVVWPTRTELFTYTSVVIVFVLAVIGVVALLDFGFSHAVQAVFG